MAEFVDKNPAGVETWVAHEDDKLSIHYRQDVEPVLDYARILRNDGLTDSGIKRDFWLYAVIPPVVILELRHKYGLDIFKRDHYKRAIDVINSDYPYLKTTEKVHRISH
jgi:hypothetical protein